MATRGFMAYVEGDTFLHRLDPRVKLFLLVVMVVLPLLFIDVVYLFSLVLAISLLAAISRISFQVVFNFIKPVLALFVFMLIIQGLWGVEPLYSLGVFTYYTDGFLLGLAMVFRMLSMVITAAIVISTTEPADLVVGMRSLGMPHKVAFMILTAFRFVPTLMSRAMLIQDAQKARGLKAGEEAGNFIKRVLAFLPVLIPLYISALELANKLSLAMEARGFGASNQITYRKELEIQRIDQVLIVLIAVTAIIGVGLRLAGFGGNLFGSIEMF